MKNLFLLIFLFYFSISLSAQNVGIGTNDPQNKLHVAGGVRIEALNGTSGIVTKNTLGDLSSVPYTGNATDVLKGNGSFSPLTGLVPSSGVVMSKTHNNNLLINAGYSLFGEMPQIFTYATTSATFPANSWQPTYTRGIQGNVSPPEYGNAGERPLAVWTGSIMYVVNSGGVYSYSPDTDIWTLLSTYPKGGGVGDRIVWTGTEIILWRGQIGTGQKYNPSNNSITTMSTANAPVGRYDHTMSWDGTRVIVWGGQSGGAAVNNGAIYNPTTNLWTILSNAGAPAARMKHTATWCSSINRLIVWGGSTSAFSGELNTGGIFNPASNSWEAAINITGAPSVRNYHTAVWTGSEMIVFGGVAGGTSLNTGGRYNPTTNTWGTATSTTGAPTVSFHAAVWEGTKMYVSGGKSVSNPSSYLYRYDPLLNTWTNVANFKEGKYWHHCFYKSNILLVWGGREITDNGNYTNTGFRYFLSGTSSSVTKLISETLYLYQKN